MLNNSGKVLFGKVVVGNEEAPFAHISSHAGHETFVGGEKILVSVTDLWSKETFTLQGIVPHAPTDTLPHSLLIEIQKDQSLKITWNRDSISLPERHFTYMRANFDVLPILIYNNCELPDFRVYLRQGIYSQGYYLNGQDASGRVLTYGLLYQGTVEPGTIMVSRIKDKDLQTRYFQIPQNLKTDFPNTTAVYVHLDENNDEAEVYLLTHTQADPLQLTQELQQKKLQLPVLSLKVPISETKREIRSGNIRLPDVEGVR